MTNKKDFVIAVLATFCLTATLFMMTSTRSQTPSATYDPLVDLNHDGTIDIYDAIVFAGHFGTSGDPAINVNVTNWPTTIQTVPATNSTRYVIMNPFFNLSSGFNPHWALLAIDTNGYRKIYFHLVGNCNITIGWRTQGAFNYSQDWSNQIEHLEEFETGISGSAWREFDIKGETMIIVLGDTWHTYSYEIGYYMTG
ncbi:MAG: hypothetical protein ABSB28_06655 [Candidatus Bathyarchaeia archaeon]